MDWIKDLVGKDPMNPENRSMLELFKIIFGVFSAPEVNAREAQFGGYSVESIATYDRVYSTLSRAITEIEATLPPAACDIPKVGSILGCS